MQQLIAIIEGRRFCKDHSKHPYHSTYHSISCKSGLQYIILYYDLQVKKDKYCTINCNEAIIQWCYVVNVNRSILRTYGRYAFNLKPVVQDFRCR